MKKIIITGGSGFVGTLLTQELLHRGYAVTILDTRASHIQHKHLESYIVDTSRDNLDPEWFADTYGIINLAGVPIFGRFTKKYKDLVYHSRIDTTKKIIEAISNLSQKPHVFVSASAIGYYGNTFGNVVTEQHSAGIDFLAQVCVDWEQSALQAEQQGIRTVILRTAHVIGAAGILGTLVPLFKKWIGGYFGNGMQHMPWIGARDLVSIYIAGIENTAMRGIYNTAVDNPTQKDFMKTIARAVGAPITWRIPALVARMIYLDFADALTVDTVIDNAKIKTTGFTYTETDLCAVVMKSINT
jgi:uncharacterized protein (TIGR01777 family)